MNDAAQPMTFKLNYTSSSKLVSVEAEHIAIASSGFLWCQIERFVSICGQDGKWNVYLDLPSLTEIRCQVAEEMLRQEFLSLQVEQVGHASRALAAAAETVLDSAPTDAPRLASEYILALSFFLALYRASDPVSMPNPSGLPAGPRPDLVRCMDGLAYLRLQMREHFQRANRRFDAWLAARMTAMFDIPPDAAHRVIRRITLDELMCFPDLRDLDAMANRGLMEVKTGIGGRSISFDHSGWERSAMRDGPDLASVGALTEPVLGRLYDARLHFGILAPAGSIILVATATPDLFHSLNDIKGIVALEGGYTSHAALMSREHGIPCLICPESLVLPLIHGAYVRLDPHALSVELVDE